MQFEHKTKYGEYMPTEGEGGSAETPQIQTAPVLDITSNFPVPSPRKVSGNRVTNWEFFRRQWEDYELGTELEHRPEPVRLATSMTRSRTR